MEILKCENVRKVYGSGNHQVVALDHIDLSVQKQAPPFCKLQAVKMCIRDRYYNGIVSLFIEGERYEQEKASL